MKVAKEVLVVINLVLSMVLMAIVLYAFLTVGNALSKWGDGGGTDRPVAPVEQQDDSTPPGGEFCEPEERSNPDNPDCYVGEAE